MMLHTMRPLRTSRAAAALLLLLFAGIALARGPRNSEHPRGSKVDPWLTRWLAEQGYAKKDRLVSVAEDGCLFAYQDIAADATILTIPRQLTLSWATVDPRYEEPGGSALNLASREHPELFPSKQILPIWLAFERHRPYSRYLPYLKTLPIVLDLPAMWELGQLDRLNGSWVRSAVDGDTQMVSESFQSTMEQLCELYPDDSPHGFGGKACDMATWQWAWATIWARGVEVEVPAPPSQGDPAPEPSEVVSATALVPFADLANHAPASQANAISYWWAICIIYYMYYILITGRGVYTRVAGMRRPGHG